MVGLMVISGFNDDLPYNIAQNGGFNGDSHGRIPPKKHIKNNKQVDSASNRFQTWRHFFVTRYPRWQHAKNRLRNLRQKQTRKTRLANLLWADSKQSEYHEEIGLP